MADSVPHGPADRDMELVMAAMERRGSKNLEEFINSLCEDDDSESLDAVDRFRSGMRDLIVTEPDAR